MGTHPNHTTLLDRFPRLASFLERKTDLPLLRSIFRVYYGGVGTRTTDPATHNRPERSWLRDGM